jgi:predicted N-acyltransferase
MTLLLRFTLALILTAGFISPSFAAKPEQEAEKALQSNSSGWTVYVDVNFGLRKRAPIGNINEMHSAMSKVGYEPVSVAVHTENGDLIGYVVTYRKR